MYREAGARRRVYFNPQHAGMHTRGVQPKTWARPGNDGKYRQVHPRESFVFGRSQWRKFRTHAQLLKAALNAKHVSKNCYSITHTHNNMNTET